MPLPSSAQFQSLRSTLLLSYIVNSFLDGRRNGALKNLRGTIFRTSLLFSNRVQTVDSQPFK